MMHFLTPLAAKKSVTNWELVCRLLKQTLGALENQTSPSFRATICCHDIPPFASSLDERFQFVIHPFPAPDRALSLTGSNNGARDMMLKRDVALYHARPEPDDFVMLLDADDLLHRDVVKDLEAFRENDVVTLDLGYEMCFRTRRVLKREDMVDKCTSTWMIKARHLNNPKSLAEEELYGSLYHSVWHSNLYEYINQKKLLHKRLEEPRVIYLVNTTLNISDEFRKRLWQRWKQKLKFAFGGTPGAAMRAEFGIARDMASRVGE